MSIGQVVGRQGHLSYRGQQSSRKRLRAQYYYCHVCVLLVEHSYMKACRKKTRGQEHYNSPNDNNASAKCHFSPPVARIPQATSHRILWPWHWTTVWVLNCGDIQQPKLRDTTMLPNQSSVKETRREAHWSTCTLPYTLEVTKVISTSTFDIRACSPCSRAAPKSIAVRPLLKILPPNTTAPAPASQICLAT